MGLAEEVESCTAHCGCGCEEREIYFGRDILGRGERYVFWERDIFFKSGCIEMWQKEGPGLRHRCCGLCWAKREGVVAPVLSVFHRKHPHGF